MHIHDLITPQRVTACLPASSKKRLLERLSNLLGEGEPELDEYTAFQALIERERLGSTGIGDGVALPHGRVKGLKHAVGAFATLDHGMDFDSADHKPVQMVFALLVPENATEEHLQILAGLAGLFRNKLLRDDLLQAKNSEEIFSRLGRANPS